MDIDNPDAPGGADTPAPAKKKGGWPAGKPRKAAATRTVTATPGAAPARERIRTRQHQGGQLNDQFAINPAMIPPGISLEWKTETVFGKDNYQYFQYMREQGWEPALAKDFPGFMPDNTDPQSPVRRSGMILMERPIELTREAMRDDRMAALGAVAAKEDQVRGAPDKNQFQRHRANGSAEFVYTNRTIEPGLPVE
jgi:hypothetical protein